MLKLAVDNEFGQTDLIKAYCRMLLIKQGLNHKTIYNREKIIRNDNRGLRGPEQNGNAAILEG